MEIPPFAGNNTFTKMDVIQFAYVEKFIFIESREVKCLDHTVKPTEKHCYVIPFDFGFYHRN